MDRAVRPSNETAPGSVGLSSIILPAIAFLTPVEHNPLGRFCRIWLEGNFVLPPFATTST
jgi:hypothetical protein